MVAMDIDVNDEKDAENVSMREDSDCEITTISSTDEIRKKGSNKEGHSSEVKTENSVENSNSEDNSSEVKTENIAENKDASEMQSKINVEEELSKMKLNVLTRLDRLIESGQIPPEYEDDSDNYVEMSHEEVQRFISEEIDSVLDDEEVKEFLKLEKLADGLQQQISAQLETDRKMKKTFDNMVREQQKFLRHIGMLEPVESRSFGVGVDMGYLPESVPLNTSYTYSDPEIAVLSPQKTEPKQPIELIELDDSDEEVAEPASKTAEAELKHPAPLPQELIVKPSKSLPPKVNLEVFIENDGITLQWKYENEGTPSNITHYNIYGYQEAKDRAVDSALWNKIGSVEAMELPMACTLSNIEEGFVYHFRVQAVETSGLVGELSDPASVQFGDIT